MFQESGTATTKEFGLQRTPKQPIDPPLLCFRKVELQQRRNSAGKEHRNNSLIARCCVSGKWNCNNEGIGTTKNTETTHCSPIVVFQESGTATTKEIGPQRAPERPIDPPSLCFGKVELQQRRNSACKEHRNNPLIPRCCVSGKWNCNNEGFQPAKNTKPTH